MGQRVQFPSTIAADSPFATVPPPGAALQGTIVPSSPPVWDPYADAAHQPPALLPHAGAVPPPPMACPPGMAMPAGQSQRLLQQVRIENTWLAGSGSDGFNVNDIDLSASFAFPFMYNPAPLLVTPGFAFHFWDGPDTSAANGFADLPPRVYDAYLDFAWQPQLTSWFAADLAFRTGVYSDFSYFDSNSLRFMGRGMGVFILSPRFQVTAGVVYLDRNNIKILPAGGVIWIPDEDTRLDIVFPNPRLSQRFTTVGNTEWWGYVSGEYGGGAWTIERLGGVEDRVDYNDLRVSLGLEWVHLRGNRNWFEVGYVFNREVDYIQTATPDFKPDDTFMLRAGATF
jgi:hypothetical protein